MRKLGGCRTVDRVEERIHQKSIWPAKLLHVVFLARYVLSFCCRHGGSGASYHGVHLDRSAAETKQLKNLKTFSQPLEASCLCLTVPLAEVSPLLSAAASLSLNSLPLPTFGLSSLLTATSHVSLFLILTLLISIFSFFRSQYFSPPFHLRSSHRHCMLLISKSACIWLSQPRMVGVKTTKDGQEC